MQAQSAGFVLDVFAPDGGRVTSGDVRAGRSDWEDTEAFTQFGDVDFFEVCSLCRPSERMVSEPRAGAGSRPGKAAYVAARRQALLSQRQARGVRSQRDREKIPAL